MIHHYLTSPLTYINIVINVLIDHKLNSHRGLNRVIASSIRLIYNIKRY